jgi:glycosyltransferase involved in cell wall biosynthesis
MDNENQGPTIAIFVWGDVVEEWLDTIGLTAADFAERMTGGWLFGYVVALRRAGWRPIIVGASSRTSTPTRLIHSDTGAPIWLVPGTAAYRGGRFPNLASIHSWLATPLRAFREVILREKCRALLIQEYEYTRFDALVRLARRLSIPAYASFQGGDRTLSWIEHLVRARSLEMCSGLIIASSEERLRVEKQYAGRHPSIVNIPNPIDSDEWRPTDRCESRNFLGLSQEAFIAINHGRISVHRKGLDILLNAWAASNGDELIIIGSGHDNDLFAALLEKSGLQNIRWLNGYTTDRPLLRRWLSAADVYITTSRVEGMPVAALEALACGLPIIATEAQGLPDILEAGEASGGLLVPREDASAVAAAIERLRADPELRSRLSRAARERIEQRFSMSVVGAAMGEFLADTTSKAALPAG